MVAWRRRMDLLCSENCGVERGVKSSRSAEKGEAKMYSEEEEERGYL